MIAQKIRLLELFILNTKLFLAPRNNVVTKERSAAHALRTDYLLFTKNLNSGKVTRTESRVFALFIRIRRAQKLLIDKKKLLKGIDIHFFKMFLLKQLAFFCFPFFLFTGLLFFPTDLAFFFLTRSF